MKDLLELNNATINTDDDFAVIVEKRNKILNGKMIFE